MNLPDYRLQAPDLIECKGADADADDESRICPGEILERLAQTLYFAVSQKRVTYHPEQALSLKESSEAVKESLNQS